MACPWAEAVARGGSVSGPYRYAQAFIRGMRRGARFGLAAYGVYHDDIELMAESVLRHQAKEIAEEIRRIQDDLQKRNAASSAAKPTQ